MAAKFENLTILFTDIVGYTDLTSQHTREQNAAMLRDYNRLILPIIAAFGGRRVKSIGDSFLATFRSPTDGVRCAMALQDATFEYNRGRPETENLRIRASLSLGEVQLDRGDIFGEPVNIASRIEAITPPDEIYFSEAVYLAMNKAEVPSESVGRQTLKGIPEPVTVYRVPRFKWGRLVAPGETDPGADTAFPFGGLHRGIEPSRLPRPVSRAASAVRRFVTEKKWPPAVKALAGTALVTLLFALVVFLRPFSPAGSAPAAAAKPAPLPPLLKLAEAEAAAGSWNRVARLADDALKDNPKNAEALLLKGHVAYSRDKKRAAALRHYGDALGLNPDLRTEPRLLNNLVNALQTAGPPAGDLLQRYSSPAAIKLLSERTARAGFAGRSRAVEILTALGEQRRINEAKRALLDLEEAPECPQRRNAVLKIRELKLKQALPTLRKMTDVGFFQRVLANHPNACLLDDAKKTIEVLEGGSA